MSVERKGRRLFVANRGEIAARVIASARELGLHTIAIYTPEDSNHAIFADEVVVLDSPSDFTNVGKIVDICKQRKADMVHPGYGFLSESPEFADAANNAGLHFIGPSSEILRQTSDKTNARLLADSCSVPTLPATERALSHLQEAQAFVEKTGFPLMIKAVDGGGGRGIRLVECPQDLADGFNRACGESPSGSVFIEKAAIHGFRHVEVQILGDTHGNVAHLWERECSIQRRQVQRVTNGCGSMVLTTVPRFQKMIELAPSTISNRALISRVIESALKMARKTNYSSLGTFEFLVHESNPEYYFLEVNPRLQVEHTITEEISGVDIVRCQILLAQGATVDSLNLPSKGLLAMEDPLVYAIQARVTAEDANKGFTLSMGRVAHFHCPGGSGIRVDTHLSGTMPTMVGSSYDSLLAKIIVRADTFEGVRRKALRSLGDTVIKGVKTNINVLLGVLSSSDFQQKRCSTRWLEANLPDMIATGTAIESRVSLGLKEFAFASGSGETVDRLAGLGSSTVLFRKGDAFKLTLTESNWTSNSPTTEGEEEFLLRLDRIFANNFPDQLSADVSFGGACSSPKQYTATLSSTTQTSVASSSHRRADPSQEGHIGLPFPGQMVEVFVDEGAQVKEGEVLCVVRQMKMELEVRAPFAGTVTWVCDVEDGEQVNEGLLVCELQEAREDGSTPGALAIRQAKL